MHSVWRERDAVEAELAAEHDRRDRPGGRPHRVVATTGVDDHGAGAADDRVVAEPAEDRDEPAAGDRDRVVAVPAVERGRLRAVAGAKDDRVVAVAPAELQRDAAQAARVEIIVSDAAVEHDPLHAGIAPDLRTSDLVGVVEVVDEDGRAVAPDLEPLRAILRLEGVLVADPLGRVLADVEQERALIICPALFVLIVDHAAVQRRAVAAVVLQVEELDSREVLAARDDPEHVVVVARVGLAPQAEVEEIEWIAGVHNEAERLREPELAVVVGIVEVDLRGDPHPPLHARPREAGVDAAVEGQPGYGTKLRHVRSGAVGIRPIGDVEALRDVKHVARGLVELEAVGVETEHELCVELEVQPNAKFEADDASQRDRLVELEGDVGQLVGEQRHRLPHHHLERGERIVEDRDPDATLLDGVLEAAILSGHLR